jgi:hypothetical protein
MKPRHASVLMRAACALRGERAECASIGIVCLNDPVPSAEQGTLGQPPTDVSASSVAVLEGGST